MNSNLPILTSQTLEEAVASTLLPQRLGAFLSGSLGIVGLLVATMGIYGVTAFAVAQRTREIGIRMALGATRTAVVGMILRFGLTLVAGGAVGRSAVRGAVECDSNESVLRLSTDRRDRIRCVGNAVFARWDDGVPCTRTLSDENRSVSLVLRYE